MIFTMNIQINPRGNGACPICRHNGRCQLQSSLQESVQDKDKEKQEDLELVIYSCPRFKEKF